MRNMEKEDCGCSCRCGGGGMRRHMGSWDKDSDDKDLTDGELAERLKYYKDDLAEEMKLIDKRIEDLKAGDTRKSGK
jgi:hypothetical protein